MLVLSRKHDEKVRIGENIWITICHISGDRVRLGIEAPPEVMVMREELLLQEKTTQQADHDAA